jgi:LPXTG-motif cell wall-anchored protein
VSAVPVDGSKITIINKPAYVLPNSGGVGTQVYTWSGMATLTIAIALYALIRRRQRNRGRGGEVS